MKKRTIILISVLFVGLVLGAGFLKFEDNIRTLMGKPTREEELLEKVPVYNSNTYNRFSFSMDILGADTNGTERTFTINGSLEAWKNIFHLYNLNIQTPDAAYTGETWADLASATRYTDLGDGPSMEMMTNLESINQLSEALNSRGTKRITSYKNGQTSISWEVPIDSKSLFGALMKPLIHESDLNGSGRMTAVFDSTGSKLNHITFVATAGNSEMATAVLDTVFSWEVVNDSDYALKIPSDVTTAAYKTATGITTNEGYDEQINPMAERFAAAYGGTAEITHYEDGAALFWTKKEETYSGTVNYVSGPAADVQYEGTKELLMSLYGSPTEEDDKDLYFYNEAAVQLIFITKTDNLYAQIIITGQPEASQGELRKPLITYKSKLGV